MGCCATLTLLLCAPCKPGDAFYVKFLREAELSDTFLVEQDTTICLPMAGPVSLAGLEKNEAAGLLQDTLLSFYARPLVKVYPLCRIYLAGNVTTPGPVYLMPQEGFMEAMAIAGTADRADLARVKIVRQGGVIGLDMRKPAPGTMPLDGDIVLVPKIPWPTLTEVYYLVAGAALGWSLYLNIARN